MLTDKKKHTHAHKMDEEIRGTSRIEELFISLNQDKCLALQPLKQEIRRRRGEVSFDLSILIAARTHTEKPFSSI